MPRPKISKRAGPACAPNAQTWWNNAQGFTPCDVYQAIMDKCGYIVPAIAGNDAYYPIAQAQLCMCNTITYNLGSACQDCQRGSTDQGILVSQYTAGGDGCPAIATLSTTLPDAATPTEEIPIWAFVDTSTQFWSYMISEQIALNTTTTTTTSEVYTATSTHSPNTMDQTISVTVPPAPSSSSSPIITPAPASSKSINAGAIGGGVAGGVVFLLAVIGLLLFLRRRRARNARDDGNPTMGAAAGRSASTSSESSLTESGKATNSTSHYTPHSQMAQLNHNNSGVNIPAYSTNSTLTTPVDAPVVPSIPYEYTTSTPARSLAASPTPSAPAVQKVKRVPVRYSEDELARAEEEARRVAQQHP